MGILYHAAGLAPFVCVFFLCKLTFMGCRKLAKTRVNIPISNEQVCNYFLSPERPTGFRV